MAETSEHLQSEAGIEPSRPQIPWMGLIGVLLATFISTLNGRLSTFGLNDVRGAMHAGFDEGAWISTSQTVAQMLIAPIAVWLGRIYGPRRVLLSSALVFGVVSFIKPFSPNLNILILLQFIGGIASGFFVPLTVGYIVRTVPPKYWAYGIAVYALNLEFSLNISASLEGWYVEHLSWYWIFWQNVPLALGMAFFLHYGVQTEPISPDIERADYFGMASIGLGLGLVYAGLDQADRLDWFNSGLIVGLFVSGGLLIVAFFLHQYRTPNPFIDMKVALSAPFPRIFFLTTFLRVTTLATSYVIPQYLAGVRGFRALETGQTLVWIAVPQLIVCWIVGLLLRRIDPRLLGSFGFVCICMACMTVAYGLTPVWGWSEFLGSQLLQAIGQSFALSGVLFYGILNLQPKDALTFGAMAQVARLMGGEVGQAFITTFVRKQVQTTSNLIGLHVQTGDSDVIARLSAYAAGTVAHGGNPSSAAARAVGMLSSAIHRLSIVQGIIDSLVLIAAMTAVALLLLVTTKAAPQGPASPKLFRSAAR
ncbi:MFS transporter [Paraburkholderia caledonica]|uniref:DHA2 family multidrug resistance protein n=1 Tax=Paraburkholderia caledonica TaxID=134536 RepID=A0ABU1KZ29_9BURK|nr:MFS transporter [Paraburkholderia caledonica]MDR6376179.1 DHA2 family multidrug resistance protein [Paraburkholderia caledonica]